MYLLEVDKGRWHPLVMRSVVQELDCLIDISNLCSPACFINVFNVGFTCFKYFFDIMCFMFISRMPNENITKKRRRGIKDIKESDSEDDEAAISSLDFNVKRLKVLQNASQEPEEGNCHGGDEVFKVTVKATDQEV